MFNVGGGEVLVIALLALIVLGPQRLPGAARQIGKTMAELRRMSSGFQAELKQALDDTPLATPGRPRDALGSGRRSSGDAVSAAVRAVSALGAAPGDDGGGVAATAAAGTPAGTDAEPTSARPTTTAATAATPTKATAPEPTAAPMNGKRQRRAPLRAAPAPEGAEDDALDPAATTRRRPAR